MSQPSPTLLTVEEVAAEVRASERTVWRWLRAGALRATKPGRRVLIRRSDLDAFLTVHEVRPTRKAAGGTR